jgi:hypothetical protein
MKLEDILELENWDYVNEVTQLFKLCRILSSNPKTQYKITQSEIHSRDVSLSLGRSWLFDITYPNINDEILNAQLEHPNIFFENLLRYEVLLMKFLKKNV